MERREEDVGRTKDNLVGGRGTEFLSQVGVRIKHNAFEATWPWDMAKLTSQLRKRI